MQPFVAVGHYFEIGKLAQPKSFTFTPVTLDDNPDFNKKSVRGTIVLRWEYVRGSTLFAVWNLATSDEDARKASPLQGVTFAARSAPQAPTRSRSSSVTGLRRKV